MRLVLQSAWRGVGELYRSEGLTHAASIAFYALLSLLPFVLLLFSVIGSLTADPAARDAVIDFTFRYFPRQFDFVTRQVEAFRTERWRAMDADVQFSGKRIIHSDKLPISDLQTHLLLEDGLLRLDPLRFGVAGGSLSAQAQLDGGKTPMQSKLQLQMRALKLKQLFPNVQQMQTSYGELNGDANLNGTGNSVATILGGANGDMRLVINDGRISKGLMEIAGRIVGNYVVTKLFGDDDVKINCAVADVGVTKGLAAPRLFAFDTENAIINVEGTANFANEKLDLDVIPHSKGVRLFSLRSPLYVHGTFKNPQAGVHTGPLLARGAGMVALGVVAGPAAGLLALIAPSKSDDNECAPLLAQLKAPAKR